MYINYICFETLKIFTFEGFSITALSHIQTHTSNKTVTMLTSKKILKVPKIRIIFYYDSRDAM